MTEITAFLEDKANAIIITFIKRIMENVKVVLSIVTSNRKISANSDTQEIISTQYLRFLLRTMIVFVTLNCSSFDVYGVKAKAATLPDNLDSKYGKWLNLPTHELVNTGREFLYQKNYPDSALVCFSIATSRYRKSLDNEEKQDIYKAYTGKWYAHFFHFYDYPKAYESLLEANKISEELGTGRGMSNFNFALMYQLFGVDGHDQNALHTAATYRQKAFEDGIAESDTNAVHLAFSNMISVVTEKEALDSMRSYLKDYEEFNKNSQNPMTAFNTLLYSINSAIANQDYTKALSLLDSQLAYISPGQSRYLIANILARANIYSQEKNYSEAERQLLEAESIAKDELMKDVLLNIYDAKTQLYEQSGETNKRATSYHDYLCLKDTLINYRQISGFNQINFLSEMEKMDATLAQIEYKRQIQGWVTSLCIGVSIVVVCFLIIILRKNRKLNDANLSLYEKNKALLDKERKENEQVINSGETPQNKDIVQSATSSLSEEDKRDLMKIIISAASTSNEIFSPKFTVAKFAEIAGLSSKLASQVINETTGDNFNAFINRYRITKACHMLDDIDTYGSYTIENIALNVGFRSRTAFISSFKKSTGLNPSDYLKAAKLARLNPDSSIKDKDYD